jgi:acetyl-CoA decarbonylase/synthase complex subunit gamma
MINVFLGYCSGVILTPALLTFLPFRMFSFKGLFVGLGVSAGLFFTQLTGLTMVSKIGWFLLIPSISSFMAMNFTGSSTYTSLSGVKKEMKISLPVQVTLASMGIILLIISWF